MHRRLKNGNALLKAQDNERAHTKEKEEAPCSELSKDQKICKGIKAFKENLSNGQEVQLPRGTLQHPRSRGRRSQRPRAGVSSCQLTECSLDTLERAAAGEQSLPFSSKENLPASSRLSLGDEFCLTPNRDKAEGESAWGLSASQGQTPVGFTRGTVAEFGLLQESFAIQSVGASPASLKFRRRAAIGARGSPENNSLIQFLAQQRSNRQKEDLAQVSPFKHVRLLKDKIDTFQTVKPVEETEETTGTSGLAQVAEIGSYFSSNHCTKDARRNAVPDLSREQEVSPVSDESKPCTTPSHSPANTSRPLSAERAQSGYWLSPVLKRTPEEQPLERVQECFYDALDGRGETLAVSSCTEIFEALQTVTTEEAERQSSEKPKKKKVTFGQDLSPEIFDRALPANAPLRRGGTPVRLQSHSSPSAAGLSLTEEPLPQPNFDCSEECEPLRGLVQDPVAAEDLMPAENAEAAAGKAGRMRTRSSMKKCSTTSEGTDVGISSATAPENTKGMDNPRRNKLPKQKNPTISTVKKPQKRQRAGCVKRRKKVKPALYGERTMASKKPLLSPVPEVSECSLSPSSLFFSEDVFSWSACKDVQQKPVAERMRGQTISTADTSGSSEDLNVAEGSSSHETVPQVSDGDLEAAAGADQEFSNVVPDARGGLDTSDCAPQSEETAHVTEAEGSTSWRENGRLEGALLNEAEWVTGLEFMEQEGARRSLHPQKGSARTGLRRRRTRSGVFPFPAFQQEDTTEDNLPLPPFHMEEFLAAPCDSFNVEDFFSVPQPKRDHSEPSGRGAVRVRRSMRLHEDAQSEGLEWILLPKEMQNCPPLLAPARKLRRSATVLGESENLGFGERNLTQFSAAGKENEGSARPAGSACRQPRRRSLRLSTPGGTAAEAQARRWSIANPVCRKGRGDPSPSEEAEIPLHSR
ncbi:cell division cycle-associated protein 2 isoform X2 [Pogoniulus pusillus]|uniref:cell division cycle-associated protein 2 isoform X2 n=1 Tax=Pogoniulus pusillus TaxID=488313 RepID=UPI0030B97852